GILQHVVDRDGQTGRGTNGPRWYETEGFVGECFERGCEVGFHDPWGLLVTDCFDCGGEEQVVRRPTGGCRCRPTPPRPEHPPVILDVYVPGHWLHPVERVLGPMMDADGTAARFETTGRLATTTIASTRGTSIYMDAAQGPAPEGGSAAPAGRPTGGAGAGTPAPGVVLGAETGFGAIREQLEDDPGGEVGDGGEAPNTTRPATLQPQGGNGSVLSDGAGATPAEIAASRGGPTAGASPTSGIRDDLIAGSTDDGVFSGTCWRCGHTSADPADFHVGHRNVPRADGGNLAPENLCLEGAACNLSAQNRGAPSPGMSCAARGSCRPWL
ncbi:MAG: HNH endonuclease, partial [Acidimicrobiales bacterium]